MTENKLVTIDEAVALNAIRSENTKIGLKVSKADETTMARRLASAVRFDPDASRTFIVDDKGASRWKLAGDEAVDFTVADYIAELQAGAKPLPHAGPDSVTTGGNATARAIATNAALREDRSEAKAAEAVALVAKYGNPWHPRSINRTHQGFIINSNPALAKKLQAAA